MDDDGSRAGPDTPAYGRLRRHRGSLLGLTGLIVPATLAATVLVVTVVAGSSLAGLPTGTVRATLTWATSSPGSTGGAQSFSGTAAGRPISGHSSPLPSTGSSPGSSSGGTATTSGGTVPFRRWTGTVGGTPFTVDVALSVPTARTSGTARQAVGFTVTGTFGSRPVRGTAAPSRTHAGQFLLNGSVGGRQVTGTVTTGHGNTATAVLTFR